LDPVCAIGCVDCCGVAEDIVEPHIGSIHDVQTP
jgi:hypothetical protein